MGLIKNFLISYDEVSEVDEGTDPIDIITGDEGNDGISINPDMTQIIIDEITEALGIDSNKPLGIGFKSKYKVMTFDDVLGVEAPKDVDAEDYLRSQGFKYIYFPEDITQDPMAFGPKIVEQFKNMMATINFIDINKTVGIQKDAEYFKGIQKLMEFSMNNGGKFSYVQGLKMLYNATLAGNAPVAEYTLSSEEMDDLADSYISSAETKKGSPLTQNEKDYLTRQLNAKLTGFQSSLSGLQPASTAKIDYDIMSGVATTIPAQAAEQPDVEGLEEELSGVVDEFIAPREELERVAELESDAATRFARTMNSLSAAESEGVDR
tara:strand:- start:196 stop:1161 length:966 start_codon:yes stop_codon:yes gene_type:complete